MNPNWDERYSDKTFAYGKAPNQFFKEWLLKFTPGHILMPADGEGRNGVFAAAKGWQVTCTDLSVEGKQKAMQLAGSLGVTIDYFVGDMAQLSFQEESFDAIGLIYAHFSADKKIAIHHQLAAYLKPGGLVIFEAFSKENLARREKDPAVGGPRDLGMLFSKSEIMDSFTGFEVLYLEEEEVELHEGKFHNGLGSVIHFVGRKIDQ